MSDHSFLFHHMDGVMETTKYDARLKRTPSMRRGKKRGYIITFLLILAFFVLVSSLILGV